MLIAQGLVLRIDDTVTKQEAKQMGIDFEIIREKHKQIVELTARAERAEAALRTLVEACKPVILTGPHPTVLTLREALEQARAALPEERKEQTGEGV